MQTDRIFRSRWGRPGRSNWRDTQTLYTLKQEIDITVSGTLPANGYAVSRSIELESISNTT
jgi:hypothetical protein